QSAENNIAQLPPPPKHTPALNTIINPASLSASFASPHLTRSLATNSLRSDPTSYGKHDCLPAIKRIRRGRRVETAELQLQLQFPLNASFCSSERNGLHWATAGLTTMEGRFCKSPATCPPTTHRLILARHYTHFREVSCLSSPASAPPASQYSGQELQFSRETAVDLQIGRCHACAHGRWKGMESTHICHDLCNPGNG
ncbi:hypothetical protein KUCAC02_021135, partial [Chaenocephalus aceratus]